MAKTITPEPSKFESTASTILGIVVVVVVGVLLFNYFRGSPPFSKIGKTGSESSLSTKTLETSEEEKPAGQTSLPAKYIVQANDNLWKISMKFYGTGYNWVDISRENNLKSPNIISVNQELTIPNVPAKIAIKTASKEGTITGNSYTVIKGDNLWKISVRAYQDGFKWPEIAKANHLTNPNVIHPGSELVIPR